MRLNRDLRYQIKALLDAGHSQKTVASQLGISPGGLSKELKRNGGREKYDPDRADRRAERLQRKAHVHYRYSDRIWVETVAMIRDGRKPYRKWGPLKDRRGSIAGRIPIALRPAAVDTKNRFGDFEIDLINGANHVGNVFTANDRQFNLCILEPLATKDAGDLADTVIAAFEPYREFLHAITSDNGKEFAGHARIARELEVGYCFARPYHSWERGANENMNGLIRQYLPKGTSFGNLTREQVKRIEWKLNNRPRKRLGFLTPLEYISIQVKQIYLAT